LFSYALPLGVDVLPVKTCIDDYKIYIYLKKFLHLVISTVIFIELVRIECSSYLFS
jgi:hypothetical protein